MLKIRFNEEKLLLQKHGLIILENPPQTRSIISGYHYNPTFQRISFDYVYYLINYKKRIKYIYEGVFGNGLKVVTAKYPLNSFNDIVDIMPTEFLGDNGYSAICTNHQLDRTKYNTLHDLTSTVIQSYWGLKHYYWQKIIPYNKMSLLAVIDKNKKANSFQPTVKHQLLP